MKRQLDEMRRPQESAPTVIYDRLTDYAEDADQDFQIQRDGLEEIVVILDGEEIGRYRGGTFNIGGGTYDVQPEPETITSDPSTNAAIMADEIWYQVMDYVYGVDPYDLTEIFLNAVSGNPRFKDIHADEANNEIHFYHDPDYDYHDPSLPEEERGRLLAIWRDGEFMDCHGNVSSIQFRSSNMENTVQTVIKQLELCLDES